MITEDKERFEKWLNDWSHQLGSHWSIYTFIKAAWKAATKHERAKSEELAKAAAKLTTTVGKMTHRFSEVEFNEIVEEVNKEFENR